MLAKRCMITEKSVGAKQQILRREMIFQYRSICQAKIEFDIDIEIAFQSLHNVGLQFDLTFDLAVVTLNLKSCPGYILETIRCRKGINSQVIDWGMYVCNVMA